MPPSQMPSWQLSAAEAHLQPVEDSYRRLCQVPFDLGTDGTAWGDVEGATSGYLRFLAEYARLAARLLGPPDPNGWLVDVSGGSGYLLRALSRGWRGALHVEAHLPSLRAAVERTSHAGLRNVVFVRGSYLKPPIKPGSASAVLATDTIIRSYIHNRLLLSNIRATLAPNGKAIIDVHARTLLRRAPSPSVTCDYSRRNFLHLLESEGFRTLRLKGGGYVPSTRSWSSPAFWAFDLVTRVMRWPSRWAALAVRA